MPTSNKSSVFKSLFGGINIIRERTELVDSFHNSDNVMVEARVKAKINVLNDYTPFKIAQRYLSLIFSFIYLLSYALLLAIRIIFPEDVTLYLAIREIIDVFKIDWIMLTIAGFYFGGGAFEGVLSKINGKKT